MMTPKRSQRGKEPPRAPGEKSRSDEIEPLKETPRRSQRGKEIATDPEAAAPRSGRDDRLPERIFATDRFPSRRVNMYANIDYLLVVKEVLKGTAEMAWVLASGFGGLFKPLRFSLVEFGAVTGLNCGEFEEGYDHKYEIPANDENFAYWERLIGKNQNITIVEIAHMVANDNRMEAWRRLRLCLLIIVTWLCRCMLVDYV
ncbi:hypothetical protein N665_0614s0012 [Sinapis alba]|nr:hypothetical protein N665_0614s0012 [Sinapis alba]